MKYDCEYYHHNSYFEYHTSINSGDSRVSSAVYRFSRMKTALTILLGCRLEHFSGSGTTGASVSSPLLNLS